MKCSHCNQEHPDNYLVCPNTGKIIRKDESMSFGSQCCEKCGKPIFSLDAQFCPYCGEPLDADEYDPGTFLIVEDVFKIDGRGRVCITGFVIHGEIVVGDEISIVHRKLDKISKNVVVAIEKDRKLIDAAISGDCYGFLLRHEMEIAVGDIVYE